LASTRRLGFKNRNFGGVFQGKRYKKPFFDCGDQGCGIISDKGGVNLIQALVRNVENFAP